MANPDLQIRGEGVGGQSCRSLDEITGKMATRAASLVRVFAIFCDVSRNMYRVFQKFVPIVNFILRKAFSTSLGRCQLIQAGNLSK